VIKYHELYPKFIKVPLGGILIEIHLSTTMNYYPKFYKVPPWYLICDLKKIPLGSVCKGPMIRTEGSTIGLTGNVPCHSVWGFTVHCNTSPKILKHALTKHNPPPQKVSTKQIQKRHQTLQKAPKNDNKAFSFLKSFCNIWGYFFIFLGEKSWGHFCTFWGGISGDYFEFFGGDFWF